MYYRQNLSLHQKNADLKRWVFVSRKNFLSVKVHALVELFQMQSSPCSSSCWTVGLLLCQMAVPAKDLRFEQASQRTIHPIITVWMIDILYLLDFPSINMSNSGLWDTSLGDLLSQYNVTHKQEPLEFLLGILLRTGLGAGNSSQEASTFSKYYVSLF